ncbi:hypothetical protein GCM10027217_24060 [Pseudomaricurvus hydrocarbonicus]
MVLVCTKITCTSDCRILAAKTMIDIVTTAADTLLVTWAANTTAMNIGKFSMQLA